MWYSRTKAGNENGMISDGDVSMNIFNQKMCCLVILILFLSGLCVDEANAESLSVNLQEYSCLEFIENEAETALCENTINTAETYIASAYYGFSSQNAYIRSSLRVLTHIFYYITDVNIHLNFFDTEETLGLCLGETRTIVVNYIHNTDGKKRI